MEGPPLGPGGEDITWPDQVAPRGRKASSTRKIKPQSSNLEPLPQVLRKAALRPPSPGFPGGKVSSNVSTGRATCPLPWAAALGGCRVVCSISHNSGYCSPGSRVLSRYPCGLS